MPVDKHGYWYPIGGKPPVRPELKPSTAAPPPVYVPTPRPAPEPPTGGIASNTAISQAKMALAAMKNRGYGMQSAMEFAHSSIFPAISSAGSVAKSKAQDDITKYINVLYGTGSSTGLLVKPNMLTSPGEW